tara:strand:+ start:1193 stop:1774 length:582 start_codon:yes stop_codon:yes gene_type:complete
MIKRGKDLQEKEMHKILDYYDQINFCGQISDPIYHPNFLNLLKLAIGKYVRISTVGSGKTDSFWDEAYSYNRGKNNWYFGVDGIDEKSEIYRVGSNFKDTWARMQQGRALGHNIVWQYIIFGYNEDDMEEAVNIARQEDFTLVFVRSDRHRQHVRAVPLRKNITLDASLRPKKTSFSDRQKQTYLAHKSKFKG